MLSGGFFWLNQLLWKFLLIQEKPELERQYHKITHKSKDSFQITLSMICRKTALGKSSETRGTYSKKLGMPT